MPFLLSSLRLIISQPVYQQLQQQVAADWLMCYCSTAVMLQLQKELENLVSSEHARIDAENKATADKTTDKEPGEFLLFYSLHSDYCTGNRACTFIHQPLNC